MARMDVPERIEVDKEEHPELESTEGIERGSQRWAWIYTVIAIVLGGAALYPAFQIEGWGQWAVFVAIVILTIGIIIAVNPRRREAG
jgi:cytochrome c oxidase subunit IV